MESVTSTASTSLASAHASSSTHPSSSVSSTTASLSSTATTTDSSSTASSTSTDTSLLSASSLSSLAKSFPTYLAIGGALLGLVIVVGLASWLLNKKRRQSRFKSRFGDEEDEEAEKIWKEEWLKRSGAKKGERRWDPETGMGVLVGDDESDSSRRNEHLTLEDARETGEEREPESGVYQVCPPSPRATSRPTMRLLSTFASPSSEIDLSEARVHFPTSIEVQSIHSYVYNTPDPSPSASPVLGPLTDREEEEERLIKRARR
ncbi:hypothetical protein IAR50_005989 [Cryptococcus sp. DSM 104548]